MNPGAVYAWILAHPAVMGVVTLWVLVNLAPRPHPEDMSGYQKVFWGLVDRLAVLTAKELPGRWKWLFAASPSLSPATELSQNDVKTDPPAAPRAEDAKYDPPSDTKERL